MMSLQKGGGARQIHNHQLRAANHLFVMEHHSQRGVDQNVDMDGERDMCSRIHSSRHSLKCPSFLNLKPTDPNALATSQNLKQLAASIKATQRRRLPEG
eukprot:scaffold2550_cov215-Alexandrium_tamarense.AAC.7